MAGKGPDPKPAGVRARRNRTSTAAKLTRNPRLKAPALPDRDEGWHSLTLAWWRDVWASPMAPEYDESDRHGLFLLAVLVDVFWRKPDKEIAAEIRLQRQCFGLTPIDRRRLQWEIERTDEAQDKGRKRREKASEAQSSSGEGEDPRAILHAV